MKRALIALLTLYSLSIAAQTVFTGTEQLSSEGRYVKITLLFGNPVRIFVTEKERARLDLGNLKMEFRGDKADKWQELKLNKYGSYYSADVPSSEKSSSNLEVRTTLNNQKTESFKFKKP